MEWEAFPIFNYDSDAGYGYGGKGFLYNIFGRKESFDLTLYNSTKGERWYRFVFSIIDMQRRQGKKYPIALDLIIDYDKWINYKYYSRIFDYPTNKIKVKSTSYKREAIEITALLSKGFVKDFIAELGVRFKSVNSSDFNPAGNDFNFYSVDYFSVRPRSYIQLASLIFNFKWDTRINYINPESGFVLEIDNEIAYDILNPPGQNFYKIGFLSQHYVKLFAPHFIFANRVILQAISEVDYQLLLPLGGNKTIRGLPQDRYLSESTILFNSELRFPIWWRLGGIAGVDIGNSETTPDWLINPVVGLRFYMDNFVVRFDVGFGKEITGIYFNFGHIF
ncbi:MAG TPA: BamA/TamA family outer membrane protein [Ignavibacteriaceae bacterium]|nr:BamA/TamA family outer membrane protein [Ignavibacteriaceae bacterium]